MHYFDQFSCDEQKKGLGTTPLELFAILIFSMLFPTKKKNAFKLRRRRILLISEANLAVSICKDPLAFLYSDVQFGFSRNVPMSTIKQWRVGGWCESIS